MASDDNVNVKVRLLHPEKEGGWDGDEARSKKKLQIKDLQKLFPIYQSTK